MEEKGIKKAIYLEVHKEIYNKINTKPTEYITDKLIKVMTYIEYNGLNEDFFEYQDELEKELENNE
jgi:hypothetical protein